MVSIIKFIISGKQTWYYYDCVSIINFIMGTNVSVCVCTCVCVHVYVIIRGPSFLEIT